VCFGEPISCFQPNWGLHSAGFTECIIYDSVRRGLILMMEMMLTRIVTPIVGGVIGPVFRCGWSSSKRIETLSRIMLRTSEC
jgi:hypothetical protein